MLGPRLRQGSCRLCLWESNSLWDIFGELSERRNFVRKIQACVNIIVSKDDGLSPLICPNCIYKVELFYDFQTSCKRSDEIQKRYNGLQDDEGAGCDAAEDVLPGMVLHCALSNSNKDAQGPVETIDIKEEPIEDEGALDGGDDEQFDDAEVEIEEVIAVTENSLAEVSSATETDQQKQKSKEKAEEGADGASGSCLQLTPPRSPSLASKLTYSASETGGSPEAGVSVEQQQQDRKDSRPDGPSGALNAGSGCADRQKVVEPQPPPPATHYNQCRFCKKWFLKSGIRCAHEIACAPLHGYAPPPPPSSHFATKCCRCCSALFESRLRCARHEFHCFRRELRVQSLRLGLAVPGPRHEVPPQAKYYNQCRFCHKYFGKVQQRRLHEIECGSRLGYSQQQLELAANAPSVKHEPVRRCTLCGKMLKSTLSRIRHEAYCRRNSAQKYSLVSTQTPATSGPADDGYSREQLELAANAPSVKHEPVRRCTLCGKMLKSTLSRIRHEAYCRRNSAQKYSLVSTPTPATSGPADDGYSREQLELAANAPSVKHESVRRCTLCGKMLKSTLSRIRHEAYCRRNSAQKNSLVSTPTPATSGPADDGCHFLSLPQCASHESPCLESPASSVAPEANAASLCGGQDVIKCRYCSKGHLKWRSLMTHEYHCRRKAPSHSEADAQVTARAVEKDGGPEIVGSGGGRDDGDESASLVQSTASKDDSRCPANRCRFCRKWFRSKKTCKLHEHYCTCSVRLTVEDLYKCSFCHRTFQRSNTCIIHERFCRSARNGDAVTVNRAKQVIQPEQQSAQTGCETALSDIRSTDRQEVISPGVPERNRKTVVTPLYTPAVDSTKETDIWTCQYCDRVFKYRESFRSHVVKCSAIATYQYSMPHDRPPRLFRCPLCRKEFKFRRKLRNHWKVCKARTSVAAESKGVTNPARAGSEWPDGSGVGAGVTALYGDASSAGEDCEEWHGWPSGQSQTVADLLTDEDSSAGAVDSCGLSCKLCDEHFCSRVLLELHTLNDCVYQRIRSDHAYAQCEVPGIDESALMRMARVELQRLLLCSCCGDIFTDRRALAEHELSERQKPTEAESPSQYDPEATHLQKRLKLGKEVDEFVLKLEGGGQQESGCRAGQLTSDTMFPATVTTFENADSRQHSNMKSVLREILCGSDSEPFVGKVEFEKQIKGDVDIQQLESTNGEKQSSNNSVLQECVINNGNREKPKCHPGYKGFSYTLY